MTVPVSPADRLGRGWPFPVMPSAADRALGYVAGADKVRQSIFTILQTEPGERLMRPDFGCGLAGYLMKPNTSAVRALMQRDISRALSTWEPRIKLEEVLVEPGTDPSLVVVTLRYTHRRDGSADSLVFHFGLEAP